MGNMLRGDDRRTSRSPVGKGKGINIQNTNTDYRDRSRERSVFRDSSQREASHHEEAELTEESIKRLNKAEDRGRTMERQTTEQKEGVPSQVEEGKEDGSEDLMKLMGFGSFGTTKNKHVIGTGSGSVKKNKQAKFRQYMNRDKGFNRALSPDGGRKRKK